MTQNSANQNTRRLFISFEVNQSKCSKFKTSASHLKSAYFCGRCKQRFILKDLLYRHLRHCSSCTSRWSSAAEELSIQRLWSHSPVNSLTFAEKRIEGFSIQSPALRPTQLGKLQFQHQYHPIVHIGESSHQYCPVPRPVFMGEPQYQYYPALRPTSMGELYYQYAAPTNALIGGASNALPPPRC